MYLTIVLEYELQVRNRISYLKSKYSQNSELNIVVYDLYDIIIDILEKEGFLDIWNLKRPKALQKSQKQ